MMIHPNFDPIALSLGPLAIRWYALSYIAGFIAFMWLGRRRIRRGGTIFTEEMLDDFFLWGVLGVILGGRLGFVLFYQPSYYFAHPLEILKVWEGGMSFHGGFLGVVVAMILFAWKKRVNVLAVCDFVAPLAPLGLGFGRIGNFINGELWGRVTSPDAFWAMGFQHAHAEDLAIVAAEPSRWAAVWQQYGMLPRHPSQLYEAMLEGLVLFALLWWFSSKSRPRGQVACVFLLGYGVARFICEFARQPDDYLNLLAWNLSMGQWLSMPMIVLGFIGVVWFGQQKAGTAEH